MRKFLVLFLMVALVPFATGCRVDGLWGYDDDTGTYTPTGTTPTSTTNLVVAVKLPATFAIKANILAAQAAAAPYLVYVKLATTSTKYATSENGWYLLDSVVDTTTGETTYLTNALTGTDIAGGQLQFRIVDKVTPNVAVEIVTTAVTTTTNDATAQIYEYAIQLPANTTVSAAAPTAVAYTVYTDTNQTSSLVNTTTGAITTTGIVPTQGSTTPTTTTANYVAWSKIEISEDGTNYSALSVDPANPSILPTKTNLQGVFFRVTFGEDVLTPTDTFTVMVNQYGTTGGTTISNTTSGVSLNYASKILTASVSTSVALTADSVYEISFTASSVKNAAGKTLELPKKVYFKSSTKTKLTWTQGQTITGNTVTLAFSKALQATQTLTGSVRLDRYTSTGTKDASFVVSMTNGTASGYGTMAIANGNLVVTFSQALEAAKEYRLFWLSGSIKDVDGNDVLVYPNPLIFKTN